MLGDHEFAKKRIQCMHGKLFIMHKQKTTTIGKQTIILSLVKQTPLESIGVKRRSFSPRSYGSCMLIKKTSMLINILLPYLLYWGKTPIRSLPNYINVQYTWLNWVFTNWLMCLSCGCLHPRIFKQALVKIIVIVSPGWHVSKHLSWIIRIKNKF